MALRKIIMLDLEVSLLTVTGFAKAVFWLSAPPNRVRPMPTFTSVVPVATAFVAWAATTVIAANSVRVPTVANGFAYTGTSGTTAAAQPTFPTTPGATVLDGGVTWTCNAIDQNSGITPAELALLRTGQLVEVAWVSNGQATLGALQTELQNAYNTMQANLTNSAFGQRLYLESWDGTTWSVPL